MNWRYMARLCVILTTISVVAAGALAYTDELTAGPIAAQVERAKQAALRQVLPRAATFEAQADLLAAAQAKEAGLKDVIELYVGRDAAGPVGIAATVNVTGYGGPLVLMAGIDQAGQISGLKIIDASSETPGLGARVGEAWFQAQFKGKTAAEALVLVKRPASGPTEVQAITAATISSSAVLRAANAASRLYRSLAAGPDRLAALKEKAIREIFPTADAVEANAPALQALKTADPSLGAATDLWTVRQGSAALGAAVAATGQGYGGLITAVVGFNPEGKIAGVRFVDLPGETVGLGSRVAEQAFTGQFAAKPAVALALSPGPPGAGEVQALTGATRSSRGALEAVNNAIAVYGRLGH